MTKLRNVRRRQAWRYATWLTVRSRGNYRFTIPPVLVARLMPNGTTAARWRARTTQNRLAAKARRRECEQGHD